MRVLAPTLALRALRVCLAMPLLVVLVVVPPAFSQSVADLRADLDVLNRQIQQLRTQLVQQAGARGLPAEPGTALERLDQLEARLRELTGQVDVLTNDIGRIVADASNRAGDIEFRLTELEGGDPSAVGPGEPLGGGLSPRPRARSAPGESTQLAITEKSDFDKASAAFEAGRHAEAVGLLDAFLATYPGGPLSSQASLMRADAFAAQENWQEAARSYLNAFSGAPQAPTAPTALFGLGESLARIGKTQDACLTFAEVGSRYPAAPEAARASARRAALTCP
jgi:tol-pal system protein YbgF